MCVCVFSIVTTVIVQRNLDFKKSWCLRCKRFWQCWDLNSQPSVHFNSQVNKRTILKAVLNVKAKKQSLISRNLPPARTCIMSGLYFPRSYEERVWGFRDEFLCTLSHQFNSWITTGGFIGIYLHLIDIKDSTSYLGCFFCCFFLPLGV